MFTASKLKLEAISSQRAKHRCSLGFLFLRIYANKNLSAGFLYTLQFEHQLEGKSNVRKKLSVPHHNTDVTHTALWPRGRVIFMCLC